MFYWLTYIRRYLNHQWPTIVRRFHDNPLTCNREGLAQAHPCFQTRLLKASGRKIPWPNRVQRAYTLLTPLVGVELPSDYPRPYTPLGRVLSCRLANLAIRKRH